ncbi:unnamed protein product [Brassica oleracea]
MTRCNQNFRHVHHASIIISFLSLFMNVFILATSDMLERIYVTAEGSE